MAEIKTPFTDRIEKSPVPNRGSHGGQYDSSEVPNTPGRTGGLYPELHRDGAITGTPKSDGPVKSPYKDRV